MDDKRKYYCQQWNLTKPVLIASTPTSHVYTVIYAGERAVLKVLTPIGERDERAGLVALRQWNGRGAVRLIQGDSGAHLLEYLPGKDLRTMIAHGEDSQATAIIAEVLDQLHTASPDAGLVTLRQRFRALFAASDRFPRAVQLVTNLLDDPRDVCVLHGDMHHANIRWHPERGWLAYDPKGLLGERTYDTANVLLNPNTLPHLVSDEARLLQTAAELAQASRLDPARVLAFGYIHACLSACWSLSDGDDPTLALHVAEILTPHLPDHL